ALLAEQAAQRRAVRRVHLVELQRRKTAAGVPEVLLLAQEEIVHDVDRARLPIDEHVDEVAADEARPPGDQDRAALVVHQWIRLSVFSFSGSSRNVAGDPMAMCQGGTSFVTTAEAATKQPSPRRTPGRIVAAPPTVTPRSIT